MGDRELVVLGTASQVPTRTRSHQATLLRWGREVVLFDPGEGTQRQLTLAGVAAGSISRICVTHLHGDHCLGLPGVLQRIALDGRERPVDLYFPAAGQEYVDRLRHASAAAGGPEVREHPVDADGMVDTWTGLVLSARALDHRVPAYGWRLQEPDGRRVVRERLDAAGLAGPEVGRLLRDGEVTVDGRRVLASEVTEPRRGQTFAFVMDTRRCAAAVELCRDADLAVCESTYLRSEADLAERYAHLTGPTPPGSPPRPASGGSSSPTTPPGTPTSRCSPPRPARRCRASTSSRPATSCASPSRVASRSRSDDPVDPGRRRLGGASGTGSTASVSGRAHVGRGRPDGVSGPASERAHQGIVPASSK